MKAVVDLKNADIDTYIAGAAGMAGHEGIVFGVPPEPFEVPDDANTLTRNLARSPVGLRDAPDPQPLHDDWVVTGTTDRNLRLGLQADPARLRRGRHRQLDGAFCSFPK